MNCEFCSGETVGKKVRKHHWLHGKLYVVENVEAEVCRDAENATTTPGSSMPQLPTTGSLRVNTKSSRVWKLKSLASSLDFHGARLS